MDFRKGLLVLGLLGVVGSPVQGQARGQKEGKTVGTGTKMKLRASHVARDWEQMLKEVADEVPAVGPIRLLNKHEFAQGREVALFELQNGLRVLVLEEHSAPLVSYQTWFRVGSRHEKPGRAGIAHLFEHMMFKGTKEFPHEVFDRLLEEAGAQVNAATWLDWTFYYENLPSTHWKLAAKLEADRMVNLVLTQEQLDTEREVVKNERRYRVENDPDGMIDEALMALVYGSHPYGHPVLGTFEDLDTLTIDECIDFYRTYYSPSNAIIVVVGDADTKDVLVTVAQLYGSMEKVDVPGEMAGAPPEQKEARVQTLVLPVVTERARLAWRTVPADSPDTAALHVAAGVLFDDQASRVYRRLVERLKLASDVDGAVEVFSLDGLVLADIVMNEGKSAEEAVAIVLDEVERLGQEGPTAEELERTKNGTEAGFLKSIQGVGPMATQLGFFQVTANDYRVMFRFLEQVRRVDSESVKRVVQRYLRRDRANIVIARPASAK